jgi:hypothetical protein
MVQFKVPSRHLLREGLRKTVKILRQNTPCPGPNFNSSFIIHRALNAVQSRHLQRRKIDYQLNPHKPRTTRKQARSITTGDNSFVVSGPFARA